MKKLFFLFIFLGIITGTPLAISQEKSPSLQTNSRELSLEEKMQKAWSDQVFWIRQSILSSLISVEDLDASFKRLMENQTEIGNIFIPYFGEDFAQRLISLLENRILIFRDIISAFLVDNARNVKRASQAWQVQTVEIIAFLNQNNPHWNKVELAHHFQQYWELISNEFVLCKKKHWEEEVVNFDLLEKEAIIIADVFSRGIEQFFSVEKK